MQRLCILTADARSLGGQLDSALDVHAPDVAALTGIGPARASRLAGPRSMRAATQAWSADGRFQRNRPSLIRGACLELLR